MTTMIRTVTKRVTLNSHDISGRDVHVLTIETDRTTYRFEVAEEDLIDIVDTSRLTLAILNRARRVA